MVERALKGTVSKMGAMRLVNVTSTKLRLGQAVTLKPKGINVRVLKTVAKQGDRKVIIIPKSYWEYFKHGSEVYIRKWRKKAMTG